MKKDKRFYIILGLILIFIIEVIRFTRPIEILQIKNILGLFEIILILGLFLYDLGIFHKKIEFTP